jgi:hypothetical protein
LVSCPAWTWIKVHLSLPRPSRLSRPRPRPPGRPETPPQCLLWMAVPGAARARQCERPGLLLARTPQSGRVSRVARSVGPFRCRTRRWMRALGYPPRRPASRRNRRRKHMPVQCLSHRYRRRRQQQRRHARCSSCPHDRRAPWRGLCAGPGGRSVTGPPCSRASSAPPGAPPGNGYMSCACFSWIGCPWLEGSPFLC